MKMVLLIVNDLCQSKKPVQYHSFTDDSEQAVFLCCIS